MGNACSSHITPGGRQQSEELIQLRDGEWLIANHSGSLDELLNVIATHPKLIEVVALTLKEA